MNVSFYDRRGTNFVRIEYGNKCFDEKIEKASPNGQYCVAAGYWYINDEASENDGDEIEGSAEAIIFENGEIVYRAKRVETVDDYTILRDDGKLCILEDDAVSVWSASQKPIRKVFPFSWFDAGINTDFAWAYGDGEDGNLRLSVFVFETGKIWTKRLSANILAIKAVLMVKDTQSSIYAVAETYENGDTVLMYDADGKKHEITAADLYKVLALFPPCEAGDEPVEHTSDAEQIEATPPAVPMQKKKGLLARLFRK